MGIDRVELIPVSENLSIDPVDVTLATQEARKGLKQAKTFQGANDTLELNSSSGTPSMKATWGILQASGYAQNSRLWQVRNPDKMLAGQDLVFENNVNIFKNEADLRVIKKQLQNYNYQGAADSLEYSDFNQPVLKSLLKYGYLRLSFDFKLAYKTIMSYEKHVRRDLTDNIKALSENHILDLLQEVYYKCRIKVQTKQYADLIVLIFAFQENVLRFLVQQKVLSTTPIQLNWNYAESQVKSRIAEGNLKQYIKNYNLGKGEGLRTDGNLSRVALITILKFFEDSKELVLLLNQIEKICNLRNDLVHDLKGVSYLENEAEVLGTIEEILKMIKPDFNPVNPFDLLNEEIVNRLTSAQY